MTVPSIRGTGAGGFVLTREEPGKWGTATYLLGPHEQDQIFIS